MKKYGLLSEIRRCRKWVNLGQQIHKYENLLARQFRADRPNVKWATDISYIHTREGVLYLSMIRDLYDNSIVAYKTASRQTVNLVLDTIRLAMKKEKKKVAAELQLHSDQGFQYTSQGYFNLTQSYGMTVFISTTHLILFELILFIIRHISVKCHNFTNQSLQEVSNSGTPRTYRCGSSPISLRLSALQGYDWLLQTIHQTVHGHQHSQ